MTNWEVSRRFGFEAAHLLPFAPAGHKCRRLHGHSFGVTIALIGALAEPEGWVCDFAAIDEAWLPLHALLDHQYLNEVDGLNNPTSENLADWIWRRLCDQLRGLSSVEIAETCTARCIYRGP